MPCNLQQWLLKTAKNNGLREYVLHLPRQQRLQLGVVLLGVEVDKVDLKEQGGGGSVQRRE